MGWRDERGEGRDERNEKDERENEREKKRERERKRDRYRDTDRDTDTDKDTDTDRDRERECQSSGVGKSRKDVGERTGTATRTQPAHHTSPHLDFVQREGALVGVHGRIECDHAHASAHLSRGLVQRIDELLRVRRVCKGERERERGGERERVEIERRGMRGGGR